MSNVLEKGVVSTSTALLEVDVPVTDVCSLQIPTNDNVPTLLINAGKLSTNFETMNGHETIETDSNISHPQLMIESGLSSGYNSDEQSKLTPTPGSSPSSLKDNGTSASNEESLGHVLTNEPKNFKGSPIMKNIIANLQPTDVILSCSGGKIGAHRIVLVAASPFIGALLKYHRPGEVAVLIIPDISKKIMEMILQLCYLGEMCFPKALENDVYEAMQTLMIAADGKFTLGEVTVKVSPPVPTDTKPPPAFSYPGHSSSLTNANAAMSRPSSSLPIDDNKERKDGSVSQVAARKKKKSLVSGLMLPEGKVSCSTCNVIVSSKQNFKRHIDSQHQMELISKPALAKDVKTLSYCSVCNTQYDSVNLALQCLKAHKCSRCFICLGTFSSNALMKHYKKAHGFGTKYGVAVKCRWCDLGSLIEESDKAPEKHATSVHHINQDNGSKIGSTSLIRSPVINSPVKRNLNVELRGVKIPELKNRKLDEHGKPLQLARRTGVPVGRKPKLKTVLPTMNFIKGPFKISVDTFKEKNHWDTKKISDLPKVHVHLDFLTEDEIEIHCYPPVLNSKPSETVVDKKSKSTGNCSNSHQNKENKGIKRLKVSSSEDILQEEGTKEKLMEKDIVTNGNNNSEAETQLLGTEEPIITIPPSTIIIDNVSGQQKNIRTINDVLIKNKKRKIEENVVNTATLAMEDRMNALSKDQKKFRSSYDIVDRALL